MLEFFFQVHPLRNISNHYFSSTITTTLLLLFINERPVWCIFEPFFKSKHRRNTIWTRGAVSTIAFPTIMNMKSLFSIWFFYQIAETYFFFLKLIIPYIRSVRFFFLPYVDRVRHSLRQPRFSGMYTFFSAVRMWWKNEKSETENLPSRINCTWKNAILYLSRRNVKALHICVFYIRHVYIRTSLCEVVWNVCRMRNT